MKTKRKPRSNRVASNDELAAKHAEIVKCAKNLLFTMTANEGPDANGWVEGVWNSEHRLRLTQALKALDANR